jgi:WD40 repeat protein
MYVAAGIDDDTMDIYYSSNLTSVHGPISADVGSGDQVNDVEFSPDSSLVAVSIGRSGNQGTNGQVFLIDAATGLKIGNGMNPNGEDRFYDSAFSPDGELIALAGNGDFYIVNITSRATVYTLTNPPGSVNAIAWSPDGNYIAMCGGYEQSGSSFDMYEFSGTQWVRIWEKTFSTSCYSTDFSYDSNQVGAGMGWYGNDANTARIYQSNTGALIDSIVGPKPSSGCNSFQGNNCGQINGLSWSPDSTHIVTSHGRNDEGVYYWFADLDEDNDGYNSTDQGDGIVDAFPTDGTQWADADNDGYGDNFVPVL